MEPLLDKHAVSVCCQVQRLVDVIDASPSMRVQHRLQDGARSRELLQVSLTSGVRSHTKCCLLDDIETKRFRDKPTLAAGADCG